MLEHGPYPIRRTPCHSSQLLNSNNLTILNRQTCFKYEAQKCVGHVSRILLRDWMRISAHPSHQDKKSPFASIRSRNLERRCTHGIPIEALDMHVPEADPFKLHTERRLGRNRHCTRMVDDGWGLAERLEHSGRPGFLLLDFVVRVSCCLRRNKRTRTNRSGCRLQPPHSNAGCAQKDATRRKSNLNHQT